MTSRTESIAGPRAGVDPRAPLRVALIASSFIPHVGGVETHVAQVAQRLQDRGHAVEVWTVDRGMRSSRPFPVPVHYLPAPLPARSLDGAVRTVWSMPRAWREWRHVCRAFAPEVLAVQCFGPNGVYASALHRSTGTPLMISSHGETLGDDNNAYRSAFLRRSLTVALGRAAAVTAPSRYVLDDLRARFGLAPGLGRIVANGVDPALGVRSPDAPRERLVLAVGRLGRMKGFDLLIDAFAQAGLAGVRLEIIGGGPERDALHRRIEAAGLGDRVRLVGERDAAGVARRIGEAAAVVVPSRSEAFGIAALEAWRGGAALVMTSRGGGAELVRDGEDAVLVDPTDTAALAAAIRSVMTDEERRLSLARRGAERVGAFGWDRIAEEYERIMLQVRAHAGSPGGRAAVVGGRA
ncbi:glycosyltransferase family 4 protein [Microbacterium sp. EF45047]|uniref:glycosyltransferase family 4 protein n=1 Tax=Microbacterium sp. EF45047 TaxID=2809708 RepID=UPI00234A0680|nr:glycosyltransferase family 4 protein [Microbacterium sp. EF45047]WCM56062.1 glycosyltransferase family 4 protein [Microbacterium sp. EF45047]